MNPVGWRPVTDFSTDYFTILGVECVGTDGVERVFNTASHHRVHHGTNPQYLDRNYAGILIVWDRLFGTFEPERERVKYGLTKNLDTFNPLKIASHEWIALGKDLARADSWRDRVGLLTGPPGWVPERELEDAA